MISRADTLDYFKCPSFNKKMRRHAKKEESRKKTTVNRNIPEEAHSRLT